jgi:hypothetical protein
VSPLDHTIARQRNRARQHHLLAGEISQVPRGIFPVRRLGE